MKIKTSELTGPALDWAVAKCEDGTTNPLAFVGENRSKITESWATCGPIIEREGILLRALRSTGHSLDRQWLAMYDGTNTGTMVQWVKRTDWPRHYLSGPTPLVAAMRCFVASKLGETVDVPAEFLA
jgi:hypothetical protein